MRSWLWALTLSMTGCEGSIVIGTAATGADGGPADALVVDGAPGDVYVPGDGATPDLIQRLLTLTSTCNVASTAKYSTDDGAAATVDICRLNGAFFWHSDMDIDCDGQSTPQCNSTTDPSYQAQTSFTQSNGQPLVASQLPYIVVPLPSSRFDYMAADIQPGAVAIVIYNGRLAYGVFGDEGPDNIIGEASYAMATQLGIDPDPATGGVDSGVTFIVGTGAGAVVSPIENTMLALALGERLAMELLMNN